MAELGRISEQIDRFSKAASSQSNSFKQAAASQNTNLTKMVKDISSHFVSQKGTLSNIAAALRDNADDTESLSKKIDTQISVNKQTIAIQNDLSAQLRASNSSLDKLVQLTSKNNSNFMQLLKGLGILGAGVAGAAALSNRANANTPPNNANPGNKPGGGGGGNAPSPSSPPSGNQSGSSGGGGGNSGGNSGGSGGSQGGGTDLRNDQKLTRGMRRNNPTNLIFVGQPNALPPPNEPGEKQAVFPSVEVGLQAGARQALLNYNGRGLKTPQDMMGRWAEDKTAGAKLAKSLGIKVTDDLNLNDPAHMEKFLRALVAQEQGSNASKVPDSAYKQAAKMASGGSSKPNAGKQNEGPQPQSGPMAYAPQQPKARGRALDALEQAAPQQQKPRQEASLSPSPSGGGSGTGEVKPKTKPGAAIPPESGGLGNPATAVDIASKYEGMNAVKNSSELNNFFKQNKVGLSTRENWCGAFVESSLKAAGLSGMGQAGMVATQWANYGQAVKDPSQVQRGDVVVLKMNAKNWGGLGGHVGIATGKVNGNQIEFISGNTGGDGPGKRSVETKWIEVDSNVKLRRPGGGTKPAPGSGNLAGNAPGGAGGSQQQQASLETNPQLSIPGGNSRQQMAAAEIGRSAAERDAASQAPRTVNVSNPVAQQSQPQRTVNDSQNRNVETNSVPSWADSISRYLGDGNRQLVA